MPAEYLQKKFNDKSIKIIFETVFDKTYCVKYEIKCSDKIIQEGPGKHIYGTYQKIFNDFVYLLDGTYVLNTCGKCNTFNDAAFRGHIDCMKMIFKTGKRDWNKETCDNASFKGHLDCLKFLHENGCPWDYRVCRRSSEECTKYFHDNSTY